MTNVPSPGDICPVLGLSGRIYELSTRTGGSALHLLAESLGAHIHHGHVDVEAVDSVPLGVTAVEAVLAWSAAVPGSTLDRPPRFAA